MFSPTQLALFGTLFVAFFGIISLSLKLGDESEKTSARARDVVAIATPGDKPKIAARLPNCDSITTTNFLTILASFPRTEVVGKAARPQRDRMRVAAQATPLRDLASQLRGAS